MERLSRSAWVLAALGLACLLAFLVLQFGLSLGELPLTRNLGRAAGLLLVAWGVLDRDTTSNKAFRGGSGAALLLVLAAVLAGLTYRIARDHDQRKDLTQDGHFTLSSSTQTVVQGLSEDVELYAFFGNGSAGQTSLRTLLRGMTELSPHLRVQFIDPLEEPYLARQFTITTGNGTVVMLQGERSQRLEARFDEGAIVDALVRLTTGQDHTICWATGHDEADPDDDTNPEGYGAAVVKLEGRNYRVLKLMVPTLGIPRECEALVAARSVLPWAPYELEALAAYIAEGGRALVLLDVGDEASGLAPEMERYGILVGDDVVWDPNPGSRMLDLDPSVLLFSGESYGLHPITAPLKAISALGISRSVQALRDAPASTLSELLRSSESSWAETNLQGAPVYDAAEDLHGPIPVAVAAEIVRPDALQVVRPEAPQGADPSDGVSASSDSEDVGRAVPADFNPKAGGRLVVFGDTDFASNHYIATGNNQDLFLNSMAWLLEEDQQLAERPDASPARLEVTMLEEALLWVFALFLVPLSSLGAAVAVMVRRRYL